MDSDSFILAPSVSMRHLCISIPKDSQEHFEISMKSAQSQTSTAQSSKKIELGALSAKDAQIIGFPSVSRVDNEVWDKENVGIVS